MMGTTKVEGVHYYVSALNLNCSKMEDDVLQVLTLRITMINDDEEFRRDYFQN